MTRTRPRLDPTKWTLVRHTGWSVAQNPQFRQAVEERNLDPKEAKAVAAVGGLIFNSYSEASDAAFSTNYRPSNNGIIPFARGRFATAKGFGEEIFIPEKLFA